MLRRLLFLADKSAFILIAPALLVLLLVAPAMARTLVEWTAFAFVLSGASIIITRICFPQIKLTDLVKDTSAGQMSSALLASTVVGFVGLLMLSLVLWGKA